MTFINSKNDNIRVYSRNKPKTREENAFRKTLRTLLLSRLIFNVKIIPCTSKIKTSIWDSIFALYDGIVHAENTIYILIYCYVYTHIHLGYTL